MLIEIEVVDMIVRVNLEDELVVDMVDFPDLNANAYSKQSHYDLNRNEKHVNAAAELRGSSRPPEIRHAEVGSKHDQDYDESSKQGYLDSVTSSYIIFSCIKHPFCFFVVTFEKDLRAEF